MSHGTSLKRIRERLRDAGLLIEQKGGEVGIAGVTDDSRNVHQGDLFCAWKGTTTDSHEHVAGAQTKGAVAAIVERRVAEATIPQAVVRDGRRAAALAAMMVYGDPQDELVFVGVTGTNGKTTTVWILRHLLAGRYRTASLGTLGLRVDATVRSSGDSLTTPGPVQLARTLRDLRDQGFEALAMEVSSHALDQGRVEALRFDAAVFTNLTRDHLDYHGSMDSYRAAKLRLLDMLRPDGTAIVNADEPAWRDSGRTARTITFSATDTNADVHASDVRLDASGAHFTLTYGAKSAEAFLPLLGSYNIENALGASAACIALGFEVAEVADALAKVPQVPGRLELIVDRPCRVLADYAHTPDALERALATLRPLVQGRLFVVFGAGGDRDRGKRPEMGAIAARLADVPVVTSDNPRTEQPDAIVDEIVQGMTAANYIRITDRREAIRYALEHANSDDLILLAGKGHEDYQVIGTTKHSFDERVIVRDLLGVGA